MQKNGTDHIVSPARTYKRLSERLQEFMSKDELHPGEKLPSERALAKSFGVSRSSVREAIRTLSEKGLLESRQGDGTYLCKQCIGSLEAALITAVDEESDLFDNVMEFRMVFEPSMAEVAASRITKEYLDHLKVITCNQHLCYLSQGDDMSLDTEFHQIIAESTRNPLFIETAKKLSKAYFKGRNPEYAHNPFRIVAEYGVPELSCYELERLGHAVDIVGPLGTAGGEMLIGIHKNGLAAGSDPRVDSLALGY